MVSAETWDWGVIRIFRLQKHARGRQIAGSSGTTMDPLHAKLTQRQAQRLAVANGRTFRDVAEEFIARKEAGSRNPKHRQQWRSTLATYAYPIVGDFSVAAVDTGLVVQVLDPIWAMKPETASRVRGRIEAVLDPATVRGYREGPNPAQWKGGLAHLLQARAKVRKVAHHAALAFDEMPRLLDGVAKTRRYGGPGTGIRDPHCCADGRGFGRNPGVRSISTPRFGRSNSDRRCSRRR